MIFFFFWKCNFASENVFTSLGPNSSYSLNQDLERLFFYIKVTEDIGRRMK